MNDMERRKFEESFREAFSQAEVPPSERVWTNIELDLIKAEGEKMKRRVLFYQLLAAASITFAVVVAGIGFYAVNRVHTELAVNEATDGVSANKGTTSISESDESPTNNKDVSSSRHESSGIAQSSKEPVHQSTENEINAIHQESESIPSNTLATRDNRESASDKTRKTTEKLTEDNGVPESDAIISERNVADRFKGPDQPNQTDLQGDGPNDTELVNRIAASNIFVPVTREEDVTYGRTVAGIKRALPAIHEPIEPTLVFHDEEEVLADPVALMFARLNDLEKELRDRESSRRETKSKEKLWTSVGFAAGAFNSITPAGAGTAPPVTTSNTFYAGSPVVQNQTKASGVSYSLGISVGTQIAERWVLQGGFNYLTEMSDYTSTQAIQQSGSFKAASVNDFRSDAALTGREKFVPTAPYTVNNSNEYISVPVQAGFLLVKRKLVWQLNAGFSTDLFLQNTIDPEGNIEKTTSGAGDDSPFRTVNFSGLVGSEVSYRFGDHYRIGLNPGIRYPFNSIYKDELGLQSSPLSFDVGLRFRYIFK